MKICTRCREEKDIEDFSWRSRKEGKRHSWCKDCRRKYDAAMWRDGNKKKTKLETRQAARLKVEEFLISLFQQNPCVDCGEADIRVLEFDHLRDKEANISTMLANACSIAKIKSEICKCEIVCKNCHAKRTITRGDSWRAKWLVSISGNATG